MRRFEKKFASPSRARKHVCSHLRVPAEAVAVETKLEAPNAEETNFAKHATVESVSLRGRRGLKSSRAAASGLAGGTKEGGQSSETQKNKF